jgi:hypothetical protein
MLILSGLVSHEGGVDDQRTGKGWVGWYGRAQSQGRSLNVILSTQPGSVSQRIGRKCC